MQNPWARIISAETDRNIVRRAAKGNHIPSHRILIIIIGATGTSDNVKRMLQIFSQEGQVSDKNKRLTP